jgi:rhodanese-related sulfurtransferase
VAAGYDARNLAGGLQQWVVADLPLEPTGGYVL